MSIQVTCRATFLVVCALLSASAYALADAPKQVDISAGELSSALLKLSKQYGADLVYRPEQVHGLATRGAHGQLTAAQAVTQLLQGTSLELRSDSSGAILIAPPDTTGTAHSTAQGTPSGSPSSAQAVSPSDAKEASAPSGPPSAPSGALSRKPRTSEGSKDEFNVSLEEILVTGTNIRGVTNPTSSVTSYGRETIDQSGYSTTQEFVRSLPQNFKGGEASEDAILTGNGITNIENASGANLRGLGTESTLVLVNGHRVAGADYGAVVDLSLFPLSSIDRIDVLTDGSSAIYGADAVGGVINIVLRKDYDGQETGARAGTSTRGGNQKLEADQTVGRSWQNGGALVTVQYQHADALRADQRSFTASLLQPTDVFPTSNKIAVLSSAHQDLTDTLGLFADVIYSHDRQFRNYTQDNFGVQTQALGVRTDFLSASGGLNWQGIGSWHVDLSGVVSRVDSLVQTNYTPSAAVPPGFVNGDPYLRNNAKVAEITLKTDGSLFTTPAGAVKAAVGGSYRSEDFYSLIVYNNMNRAHNRSARSVFGELYIPLVGESQALTGFRRLAISAAVRHDSYTDFGTSTNPKVSLLWSPIEQLDLRGSYSTNFQTPTPFQQISVAQFPGALAFPGFSLPGGGTGNALVVNPLTQNLIPEKANSWTASIEFHSAAIPKLKLSADYFNIKFTNRIISAPFSFSELTEPEVYGPLIRTFTDDATITSYLNQLVASGYSFSDFTPGGTGTAGIRYAIPFGLLNAAHVRMNGVDVGAQYAIESSANKLQFDLNVALIDEINTGLCESCRATDIANTYNEPLKFRARSSASWSHGSWQFNTAVNYSNGYENSVAVPKGHISSYTIIDLNVRYSPRWLKGLSIGANVANVLDTSPPLVASGPFGLGYDPANADPLGRFVSLQTRMSW